MANTNINFGSFIPSTYAVDVSRIYEVEVGSAEFKQLIERLATTVNNIAVALNTKESSLYPLEEFITSALYFNAASNNQLDQRQEFRKVINFGALPNAGAKSVAHGIDITNTFSFTFIGATASDTTGLTYIPIPYVALSGDNIQIDVDSTNVTITTTIDRTNYNICYVVLKYLKN